MPQPRVIIPGFRIGTLNGDAFSLVRARAPRRNVKKLYNREFSKCNETCQSPDNRFNDTKADGTIFNRIFLPPPPFFLSLSFLFLPPPLIFSARLVSQRLSPSRRCGVTLPFRLLISPSGRFDRVNTGWNIGETGGVGDTFTRANALHRKEVCIGVVLVSKSLIAIVCGFNRKLVLASVARGGRRGQKPRLRTVL